MSHYTRAVSARFGQLVDETTGCTSKLGARFTGMVDEHGAPARAVLYTTQQECDRRAPRVRGLRTRARPAAAAAGGAGGGGAGGTGGGCALADLADAMMEQYDYDFPDGAGSDVSLSELGAFCDHLLDGELPSDILPDVRAQCEGHADTGAGADGGDAPVAPAPLAAPAEAAFKRFEWSAAPSRALLEVLMANTELYPSPTGHALGHIPVLHALALPAAEVTSSPGEAIAAASSAPLCHAHVPEAVAPAAHAAIAETTETVKTDDADATTPPVALATVAPFSPALPTLPTLPTRLTSPTPEAGSTAPTAAAAAAADATPAMHAASAEQAGSDATAMAHATAGVAPDAGTAAGTYAASDNTAASGARAAFVWSRAARARRAARNTTEDPAFDPVFDFAPSVLRTYPAKERPSYYVVVGRPLRDDEPHAEPNLLTTRLLDRRLLIIRGQAPSALLPYIVGHAPADRVDGTPANYNDILVRMHQGRYPTFANGGQARLISDLQQMYKTAALGAPELLQPYIAEHGARVFAYMQTLELEESEMIAQDAETEAKNAAKAQKRAEEGGELPSRKKRRG